MSDEAITFVALGAVVAVFVWDTLPVAVVAVGVALSLWATGVLELQQSLAGPRTLLLGLVVLVFVLGQLISNTATVLIAIPVALSATAGLDASAKPVLMAVCVASAAAFLTPVATPANLMVMEPGGSRFGNYWRLGLPLLVLFGVVAVLFVPVVWSP